MYASLLRCTISEILKKDKIDIYWTIPNYYPCFELDCMICEICKQYPKCTCIFLNKAKITNNEKKIIIMTNSLIFLLLICPITQDHLKKLTLIIPSQASQRKKRNPHQFLICKFEIIWANENIYYS